MLKRKNEAPLTLPPDHPVRRLFQRFRQQREARLASEQAAQGAADLEKGGVILEPVLTSSSAVKGTERPDPPCSSETSCQAVKATVGKAGSWSSVSGAETADASPDRTKSHNLVSLKKTDSCDSGLTRSDLRLDNVGGARTPQEQSPVQPAGRTAACPLAEQNLRASFTELRQDLRGHLGSLNSRMAALEVQLLQLLQCLQTRKVSGSLSEASPPSPADSGKESSTS